MHALNPLVRLTKTNLSIFRPEVPPFSSAKALQAPLHQNLSEGGEVAQHKGSMELKKLRRVIQIYMGVSKNRGTSKSSILIGFSIVNHPFWGTTVFGNSHMGVLLNGGTRRGPPSYKVVVAPANLI